MGEWDESRFIGVAGTCIIGVGWVGSRDVGGKVYLLSGDTWFVIWRKGDVEDGREAERRNGGYLRCHVTESFRMVPVT